MEACQGQLAVTQEELAYWSRQHPAPGMQVRSLPEPDSEALAMDGTAGCLAITWPYAPPHLGIGSTEEVLVTFNGLSQLHSLAARAQDRHHPGK